jgi:hypothetical protein
MGKVYSQLGNTLFPVRERFIPLLGTNYQKQEDMMFICF